MSPPSITVVITCQDRRTFILEAVESAVNQDLDRTEYEVIVVKNFEDEKIDDRLDELGVKRILCDRGPASHKQVLGIKEAKGDIISILEDDDLFSNRKLSVVRDRFIAFPSAVLYHNGMCFDQRDMLSDMATIDSYDLVNYDQPKDTDRRALRRLNLKTPDYNPSSMSFRRDFALGSIEPIMQSFRDVDSAWYLLSLDSRRGIIADDTPLTFYRRHQGGSSRATSIDKIQKYCRETIESHSILMNFLHDPQIKEICSYYIEDWKAKLVLLSNDETKRERFSVAKKYVKNWEWRATTKWYLVVLFLLLSSIISIRISTSAYPKFFR